MQLADSQERHAAARRGACIEAERKLAEAASSCAAWSAQAQEAQFALRSLAARRAELQRAIETAAQQIAADVRERRARAGRARAPDRRGGAGRPAGRAGAEARARAALGAKRSEYDDLTAQLRRADEQRLATSRASIRCASASPSSSSRSRPRSWAASSTSSSCWRCAGRPGGARRERSRQATVKLAGLQGEIDRLHREIAALGAVNLAALDELATARERKTFLDAQTADLNEAMTTLEDAIRKIDLETRELLATTFDQVNEHFGRMFPELFGGGNAKLVMTGDEILDAGVQVMAQPPGKKNRPSTCCRAARRR